MKILPCNLIPLGLDLAKTGPSSTINHTPIVVTRYFLVNSGANELDDIEEWFEDRNELFNKYTLPSLRNQSMPPARWYIFIEKGYERFLPESIHQPQNNLQIIIHLIDSSTESYSGTITRLIESEKSRESTLRVVSCTRIDNDDTFEPDFIEVIDALVQNSALQNDCVISLPFGKQLDITTGEELLYLFTNNHFLTSIHKTGCATTNHVHSFDHTYTFSADRRVELVCTSKPVWIEVVHGKNLRNRTKKDLPRISNHSSCITSGVSATYHEIESAKSQYTRVRSRMEEIQRQSKAMKPPKYFDAYAQLLQWKHVDSMLEIGIHEGGSLKFWRSFFGPETSIYGIDINPECTALSNTGATEIRIGSQVDTEFISSITKDWQSFDLIIDDGSHRDEHMKDTMLILFPSLNPGGIYIVEDMFTSFWSNWGGGLNKKNSFIETSKSRIDTLFREYMSEKYKKHHDIKAPPDYTDDISASIDSIHFFGCGITAFTKKQSLD